jgi:alkylglycerol monooxygenase
MRPAAHARAARRSHARREHGSAILVPTPARVGAHRSCTMSLVAASIPAFIVLMGVELLVARRKGARVYRFVDAVTDLGCGISSQLVGLLFVAAKLLVYAWVFEHARLFELSADSIWTYLFAILVLDFTYYWWHRLSHEVNVLWAAHVVHHQSEDYNLAVALRQAWLTGVTILPFELPLALLGVPVVPYAVGKAIVTLYQFWIHTELVRRCGPLEGVLNTPSHHRVHHAIDPEYLDRNYGGIFIVWDRLFGTFEPERRRPTYGITKPLRSFNPVWANFHVLAEMAAQMRATPRWRDKLRVLVAPPRWRPPGVAAASSAPEAAAGRPKHEVPISRAIVAFVALQLATTVLGTTLVLWYGKTWGSTAMTVTGVILVIGTLTAGGIMERKRWAWPLEAARILAAAVAVAMS